MLFQPSVESQQLILSSLKKQAGRTIIANHVLVPNTYGILQFRETPLPNIPLSIVHFVLGFVNSAATREGTVHLQ